MNQIWNSHFIYALEKLHAIKLYENEEIKKINYLLKSYTNYVIKITNQDVVMEVSVKFLYRRLKDSYIFGEGTGLYRCESSKIDRKSDNPTPDDDRKSDNSTHDDRKYFFTTDIEATKAPEYTLESDIGLRFKHYHADDSENVYANRLDYLDSENVYAKVPFPPCNFTKDNEPITWNKIEQILPGGNISLIDKRTNGELLLKLAKYFYNWISNYKYSGHPFRCAIREFGYYLDSKFRNCVRYSVNSMYELKSNTNDDEDQNITDAFENAVYKSKQDSATEDKEYVSQKSRQYIESVLSDFVLSLKNKNEKNVLFTLLNDRFSELNDNAKAECIDIDKTLYSKYRASVLSKLENCLNKEEITKDDEFLLILLRILTQNMERKDIDSFYKNIERIQY